MHAELLTRRRALAATYRRYLEADRAWHLALREVNLWFPVASRPVGSKIGNPGSRIRMLFERRERALLQLEAMRLKLAMAKRRLAERNAAMRQQVLLITRRGGCGSGAATALSTFYSR